jgi:hypothetical protein
MAEEEFDLLQIPAIVPAQLGAGAAEVVGAGVLDLQQESTKGLLMSVVGNLQEWHRQCSPVGARQLVP